MKLQTTKVSIILLNHKSENAIFRSFVPSLFHEVVRWIRTLVLKGRLSSSVVIKACIMYLTVRTVMGPFLAMILNRYYYY